MTIRAIATDVVILGEGNGWKVATQGDLSGAERSRRVELEIQGDDQHGYHLVMSPEGCLVADTWHRSQADALAEAQRLFGVPPSDWA